MTIVSRSPKLISPRMRDITVLMTDMYASTIFTERHGNWAAYHKRQKHNSLLLPLIREKNGILVEVVGDSLLAFFEESFEAARCACAMQRSLLEYNRSSEIDIQDFEIHIRVGIHRGKAIIHEQLDHIALTGQAVNVAARVEAGDEKKTDQILLSDSVWEQLRADSEFVIVPVGIRNVKGIDGLGLHRLIWGNDWSNSKPKKLAARSVALGNHECVRNYSGDLAIPQPGIPKSSEFTRYTL